MQVLDILLIHTAADSAVGLILLSSTQGNAARITNDTLTHSGPEHGWAIQYACRGLNLFIMPARLCDCRRLRNSQMTGLVQYLGWPMWYALVIEKHTSTVLSTFRCSALSDALDCVQVTCMFYLIDAATKDVVEGGNLHQQRPPWLGGYCITAHIIC